MENNNDAGKGQLGDGGLSDTDKSENMPQTDVFKTESSQVCIVEAATDEVKPKIRLPLSQKAGYSVGHVYNDLCASMWFTYTLLFFTEVLGFSQSYAGLLILIGQVADALCTPVIGLVSDKQNDQFKICLYGRRKIWHLIGTLSVSVSFPFLFIHCLGCQNTEDYMQMIYYSSFIIIFQFGWASVQVAHLSLIPDLTKNPNEKTELSANRNVFTVLSNVCVYGIAWAILGTTADNEFTENDLTAFRNIALIVTGIGIFFSIIFHIAVKEPKLVVNKSVLKLQTNGIANGEKEIQANGEIDLEKQPKVKLAITEKTLNWKKWLKQSEFYKVAILYMCTRLFGNLSQTYIALFLDEKKLPKNSVAYIPLLVYVSGFLASLVMKQLNKKAGRMLSYIVGDITGIGFCIWIYFSNGPTFNTYQIYIVAVLMGVSGSVMLITCLGITADLIGDNVQSGAFVFGAMSFADKLSNGIVVAIVQYSYNEQNKNFYRDVISIACGIPAVISFITIFTISKAILNSTKVKKHVENSNNNTVNGDISLGQINEGYTQTEKY
ncbi:Major facilitator super domain-containing protein 12 [Chamberlinius hualienensis]